MSFERGTLPGVAWTPEARERRERSERSRNRTLNHQRHEQEQRAHIGLALIVLGAVLAWPWLKDNFEM